MAAIDSSAKQVNEVIALTDRHSRHEAAKVEAFPIEALTTGRPSIIAASPCAELACVYLSSGRFLETDPAASITLEITGNEGKQKFTFSSAMPMMSIVNAINLFARETGVSAEPSEENPQRVAIKSFSAGDREFVSVRQLGRSVPVLFEQAVGGVASSGVEDTGADGVPGDLDCDHSVNFTDLLILLDAWGACDAKSSSCSADFDASGTVDFVDLLILLAWWS